jgi:hypothetical protein
MKLLTHNERKEQQRVNKELNKMITLREVNEMLMKAEKGLKKQYDIIYTLAMCNALHAEPFKFGRGRLATFLELFFGQIEGLHKDTIDLNMLGDECERMGVKILHNNGQLEIEVLNVKCN